MYYWSLLNDTTTLGIDFDLLPDFNAKTFYWKLITPDPVHLPCTRVWNRRLNTSLAWPHIWPSIYGGLSTNWESDIAWKVAHGVLKARVYLKRWHQLSVSELCAMCRNIETCSHIFCDCLLSTPVWDWTFSIINKL